MVAFVVIVVAAVFRCCCGAFGSRENVVVDYFQFLGGGIRSSLKLLVLYGDAGSYYFEQSPVHWFGVGVLASSAMPLLEKLCAVSKYNFRKDLSHTCH